MLRRDDAALGRAADRRKAISQSGFLGLVSLHKMPDLCSTLIDLLVQQSRGDQEMVAEIGRIASQVCGERVYRDPVLSSQQVRGMELVLDEWRGMFSFSPGRTAGLAPLIRLLQLIHRKPEMDQLQIYETSEWKEIVGLRGPVETVLMYTCGDCATKYARMGTSGFLDILDYLCGRCGAVTFRSVYRQLDVVHCACGGCAKPGCPSCGSTQGAVIEELSPYEYFADHAFFTTSP